MFSGIIRATAKIKQSQYQRGSLLLTTVTPRGRKVKAGDSIATDGVCLTVAKASRGSYQCELMPETLSKTTFGIALPTEVNLERPLTLQAAIDGHLVTGHIDTIGKIIAVRTAGDSRVYTIGHAEEFGKLVAPKGSVTVDGVSLTVVEAQKDSFTVSLVTYTIEHTTLGNKAAGDLVNLEFDILAKYIAATLRR